MEIDPNKARNIGRTINKFLTPYAVFLVAMGAVAAGINRYTIASVIIVVLTAVGNVVFVNLMQKHPDKAMLIRNIRIGFNYFFNISIVGMLWPIWPPIWMLLLLSICTVGIFEDRRATAITATMFTIVLACVQFLRGDVTVLAVCELVVRVASIWVAGLLINRLVHEPEASA